MIAHLYLFMYLLLQDLVLLVLQKLCLLNAHSTLHNSLVVSLLELIKDCVCTIEIVS